MADFPRYEAARRYTERGWAVLPLHHITAEGVCSCRKGGTCGRNAGKHPRNTDWPECDITAAGLFDTFGDTANVGIITGHRSGIWVVDVDPDNAGYDTLADLLTDNGQLPDTYTVETGSGGTHYYFALPDTGEAVRSTTGALGQGIDTRGEGGMVVAPPSTSGKGPYRIVDDRDPVEAPAWLTDKLHVDVPVEEAGPPANPDRWLAALLEGTAADLDAVTHGRPFGGRGEIKGWNDGTYTVAARLAEVAKADWNELTPGQARTHLHDHAPLQTSPTADWPYLWTSQDVEDRWTSAWRRVEAATPPRKRPEGEFIPFGVSHEWDDLGNAQRLLDRHADQLRWVTTDKAWAVYMGGRWRRRTDALASTLVARMVRSLEEDEADSYSTQPDDKGVTERDRFLKWARGQGAETKMAAALNAAKRLPEFHATVDEFDSHPMLLNAPNGVLDLETGRLGPHDPSLMLTAQTAVPVDLEASCPRWDAFLKRVMPGDDERAFLARAVGYSLTGTMTEQVLFMHHGEGANGKSVFLDVIGSLLGDYGQVVPRQTLLVKRNDGIPTDIARMLGKRFLQTNETSTGRQLDEEVVKSITGGDRQVARHLHGDEFEFRPQGKLHYVTNHLPHLTDAESIWRRIVLLRWGVVIPEGRRDGNLSSRIIREEAAGVLAWAIRGCAVWAADGLGVPLSCRMDRDAYRDEQDILGEFLNDTLVDAPGQVTQAGEIYTAYQRWALDNGHRPMASQTLSKRMKERGYELDRKYVPNVGTPRCVIGVITRDVQRVSY